jgi:hypothetical protein
VTGITTLYIAKTVPGAPLAYLLHISLVPLVYCKHHARPSVGTDLAREKYSRSRDADHSTDRL